MRVRNKVCTTCGLTTYCQHSGLLCQNCNALLGMANEDSSVLQAAIDYLEVQCVPAM